MKHTWFPKKLINGVLFMVLIFLFLAGSLHAQQNGVINGQVLDPGGNALPKATVVLQRENGVFSRQTTSDSQGRFTFQGLPAGSYSVNVTAEGFSQGVADKLQVTTSQPVSVTVKLTVGSVSQEITVNSTEDSDSLAAKESPLQAPLDAESARSEFSSNYIQDFSSPTSDYGSILQMAPGTFSISPNGLGLGQDKTYFRGFADGNYDITWDGIPFNDTNSPTHHSWAFFPSQWLGGIDFDRSPGTASTVGPTPFGGSINLLSKSIPMQQSVETSVAYGSFNTLLIDGQYNTGSLLGNKKSAMTFDIQRLTSDGFQTYNYQTRVAGDMKLQYKISDKTVLTGYSGWVMLDNNTPNTTTPTRTQVQTLGYNYLLTNDPTSPYYYGYNGYHLPTNFSYVGIITDLGHGWRLDAKPYSYSYKNHQWYTDPPLSTFNSTYCATTVSGILPCASDQLNGYHKYGEVTSISQSSHYGVFRTGLWYEYATTNRYLYPENPFDNRSFGSLPSYREHFTTSSYQPFAEYEYMAIPKLTVIGGFKYAYYNQNLTQYPDNGKTIGTPANGAAAVYTDAGYHSFLPALSANYRLLTNWSVYGQFAQGSIIPPSSVFDVKTQSVSTLPNPARTTAYQAGTVLKLNRIMFDADFYRIKYQNAYASYTATDGSTVYYLNPDSVTIGTEMETNVALTHGIGFYANGSAGQAQYTGSGVPSGLWVANTPAYTLGSGFTYQQHNFDLGVFQKLIGPMWSDNKTFHKQVYNPAFNTANMFLNYTVRNHSRFDQTKISVSLNNIFNSENIIGVNPGTAAVPVVVGGVNSTYLATTTLSGSDLLTLTPGRSIMFSVTFGLQGKQKNQ